MGSWCLLESVSFLFCMSDLKHTGMKTFHSFVSLLLLILNFRRRKQDKSRTKVRKYGIRTNRSDLEMEPLPLSDDDEDETVFDLTASRTSHR